MHKGEEPEEEPASKKLSFEEAQLEIAKQQLEISKQQLEIDKRQQEIDKETLVTAKIQAAAAKIQAVAAEKQTRINKKVIRPAWLAVLAAFLAVGVTAWPILNTAKDVKSIEKEILSSKLVISSLSNGDQVSIDEVVSGFTPYPKRHHYLVATPLKIGDSYVQDPATVRADGTWTGSIKFGSGEVGLNEKFVVRCLATEAELTTGSLASQPLPPDAAFSSPVIVTRTH